MEDIKGINSKDLKQFIYKLIKFKNTLCSMTGYRGVNCVFCAYPPENGPVYLFELQFQSINLKCLKELIHPTYELTRNPPADFDINKFKGYEEVNMEEIYKKIKDDKQILGFDGLNETLNELGNLFLKREHSLFAYLSLEKKYELNSPVKNLTCKKKMQTSSPESHSQYFNKQLDESVKKHSEHTIKQDKLKRGEEFIFTQDCQDLITNKNLGKNEYFKLMSKYYIDEIEQPKNSFLSQLIGLRGSRRNGAGVIKNKRKTNKILELTTTRKKSLKRSKLKKNIHISNKQKNRRTNSVVIRSKKKI